MQFTNGKVYSAHVEESEIDSLSSLGRITNISKDGDKANVRLISDNDLSSSFEFATPTLEDYYLYVFGQEIPNND